MWIIVDQFYGLLCSFVFVACDPHCDASIGCNARGGGLCDGNCTTGYGPTSYGSCLGEIHQFRISFCNYYYTYCCYLPIRELKCTTRYAPFLCYFWCCLMFVSAGDSSVLSGLFIFNYLAVSHSARYGAYYLTQ